MNPFQTSIQRFDEFADEYASRFMNVDDYKDSIDKFCDCKSENPKILDLACGPGNYTRYLQQKFPQSSILAIDLAPRMIELAKKQLKNARFEVMDMKNIHQLSETFDLILCSFGLPFLTKAEANKFIADCASHLKKNGRLYISTMEGDESEAGFETTSFTGSAEVYFNYHRQEDIEVAIKTCGLQLEYLKKQDYLETDGNALTDMIFIAAKS